jgi:hypothetical protein
MQIFNATLTFGASGTVSLSDLAGNNFKATRIHIEPANANTHVAYMGGPGFAPGTSLVTGLIHQFQIPDASNLVPLDSFELACFTGKNEIQYDSHSFKFSGTNGEKLVATVYVA